MPADVYLVDALLTQIEEAKGIPHRIGIEVLIETALGMANVEAIAQSSRRLEAMHFGVADYAASCGRAPSNIGGLNPDYPGRPVARRALAAWSSPAAPTGCGRSTVRSATSRIPTATRAAARRGAALGIEGKWAIHPSQIALANEVFTPAAGRGDRARRILEALERGGARGQGAAQLDGRMIDAASARMAQNVVEWQDRRSSAVASDGECPSSPADQTLTATETSGPMDIHEYQAKELLAGFGVADPARRRGLQPGAGGLPRLARSAARAGR